MSQVVHALTHGWNGFILGYMLVLIPLLFGLRHGRAPADALWRGPLLAIPVTLIGGIAVSILSSPLRTFGVDKESGFQLVFGALVSMGVGYLAGRVIAAKKGSPDAEHRRGAVVMSTGEAHQSPRWWRQDWSKKKSDAIDSGPAVTLAGIHVAAMDETKHFKLIGTTGTGKSTAIRELLEGALARGDRAVIADPDGGYLNTFYNAGRGDVILNPFAAASAKWNLLGEIINDYDVEQLARSLIPDSGDPDRIWADYARTFFTAVVQQVISTGVKDDSEVDRLFNSAPDSELRGLLAKTSAGPLLAEGNDRMFGCVRTITTAALRPLKYVTRQEGAPFSVRKWVSEGASRHAGGRGGVLFIPYKAGEIAALRAMISAWMRLAIFEAMNRPEGDQRLWFVVDELDALGEIDGLKDALARLRKFGGRSVLGFQSIAQVSSTYGSGVADTIVENCGNTLILRCSASERGGTSEFVSKLIGQREVTHTTQSRSRRPGEWRKSTTTSEHVKIEPAVMSSEIERLPDLEGYLKFASVPDWRRVRLVPARGSARMDGKQRAAGEVRGGGPSGVVVGGTGGVAVSQVSSVSAPSSGAEPVAGTNAAQPGSDVFKAPPGGVSSSARPPRARAFKKVAGTPVRKRRVKATDAAVTPAAAVGVDPRSLQ
jgi:type IV secretory pathway TraG/TraD family ATPase VirD4